MHRAAKRKIQQSEEEADLHNQKKDQEDIIS